MLSEVADKFDATFVLHHAFCHRSCNVAGLLDAGGRELAVVEALDKLRAYLFYVLYAFGRGQGFFEHRQLRQLLVHHGFDLILSANEEFLVAGME